ncbi:hypothetical protein [Nostoc sphaeroides]|uniref:Uncharacterized protein n=1 Tax=Nostoc sphaeroides CCNUC1 TaxID=2653204 RepID=A0A5P8VQL0_9NOSO|nr:hypothetical protein [Nostoc sphaeroides]QFS42728.1 hypothetical protein GXM_00201 [Nostoc sphaeroides CCNUC1]
MTFNKIQQKPVKQITVELSINGFSSQPDFCYPLCSDVQEEHLCTLNLSTNFYESAED